MSRRAMLRRLTYLSRAYQMGYAAPEGVTTLRGFSDADLAAYLEMAEEAALTRTPTIVPGPIASRLWRTRWYRMLMRRVAGGDF